MAIHTCPHRLLLASLLWGSWLGVIAQTPDQFFTVRTFNVPAKLTEPFRTGLHIGFDDFVYIEAQNKIGVGLWYGETYAVGMKNTQENGYNKYPSFQHGALIWQIGPGSGVCRRLFESTEAFSTSMTQIVSGGLNNQLVSKKHMVTDDGTNYVPGDYFLSESTGELLIDINDKETDNNWGEYKVAVVVIKEFYHINRNQFNRCPHSSPQTKLDASGNGWTAEKPALSIYYHGPNMAYRGSGGFAGCQCVYKGYLSGPLLKGNAADPGQHQGTFDFGFWQASVLGQDKATADHLHLILDVLPHDCWVKRYGGNSTRMRYSPTQAFIAEKK